jgi:hypothetical protein
VTATRSHCKHGHALTPENTKLAAGTGRRLCQKCAVKKKQGTGHPRPKKNVMYPGRYVGGRFQRKRNGHWEELVEVIDSHVPADRSNPKVDSRTIPKADNKWIWKRVPE